MPASDYVRIVDPRHEKNMLAAEDALKRALPEGQGFVCILVDPPEVIDRKASFFGTFIKSDVAAICGAMVNQIASQK